MAVNMGNKSVYIRAFWPREISQSTSQRSIQSNNYFMNGTVSVYCGDDKETRECVSRLIYSVYMS